MTSNDLDFTEFTGRCAFITGGASGIGLGIAQALVARGMSVVLADIDGVAAQKAAADLAAAGGRAIGLKLDVRDPGQWTSALDAAESALGPLAILVSNAGVGGSVLPVVETTPAGWAWTIDVNLNGTFHAARLGVPRLLASGKRAHFVSTASLGAFLVQPANGAYSATKAAVIALCEALRAEMAQTAVAVSVLSPGIVRTALLENGAALGPVGVPLGGHSQAIHEAFANGITPRSVGEMVARGIAQRRFWLFTAPELAPYLRGRFAEIEAALEADAIATAA